MKQQLFEAQHQATWQQIEESLEKPSKSGNSRVLAENYLLVCQHLSIAKERLYDAALVERLNNLVLDLYRELYRYRAESRLNIYAFFKRDFPLAIYRHRYFILVALLVLVMPGLIAGAWTYIDEDAVYSVLDGPQVREIERMYDPEARKIGREREADTDIFMFGFYIKNNISVAFRCFAGGIVVGIGTLLVLFFNGMFMGSIAGHLTPGLCRYLLSVRGRPRFVRADGDRFQRCRGTEARLRDPEPGAVVAPGFAAQVRT